MRLLPRWLGLRDRAPAAPPGPRPVGLLACAGRLPIAFAEKARAAGVPVVCVGVAGMADPALESICPEFPWLRRASLGFLIRTFRRAGVGRWSMADPRAAERPDEEAERRAA